jgi:hypothetical protein
MLTVTHVAFDGSPTPFEAPPPKPGQSFMVYLAVFGAFLMAKQ